MRTRTLGVAVLGLACTSLATAQDRSDAARIQDAQTRELAPDRPFHVHGDVIGHAVVTASDGTTTLGEIDDLVIDCKTGRITHAIVTSEETLRAIQWSELEWSADEQGDTVAALDTTEEAFSELPKLEKKDVEKIVGARAVDASASRLDAAGTGAGADAAGAARDAAAKAMSCQLVSKVQDVDVYADGDTEEAMTTLGELVLDCQAGRVAFATIEAGRASYLVPIEKLSIRPMEREGADAAEEDDEPKLAAYLAVSADELEGAPRIDERQGMTASNERFREQVYDFFGVQAPAARMGKGGAGSGD